MGESRFAIAVRGYLHQETGLAAGTVPDDNKLAADLGHN